MDITPDLTDPAILAELGARLARRRIETGLTQQARATEAGVGKRTVERLEAGQTSDLVAFLKVLRALGLLANLNVVLPPDTPGPMELLELRGRERKRVRPSRRAASDTSQPWTWGDR